jgi:hypothetical protein
MTHTFGMDAMEIATAEASGETGTPRLLMKTQSTWGKPGESERCAEMLWIKIWRDELTTIDPQKPIKNPSEDT